jgi:hypothetical protein
MRNCEYIGNPAMFQSRVSGIGVDLNSPTQYTPAEIAMQNARAKYASDMALWEKTYGASYSKMIEKCPRCITTPCPCPTADNFLKRNPLPVMQQIPVSKQVSSASPTAFSLPLLIGAAYLLLS